MSGIGSTGRKVGAVFFGAVAALTGYAFVVKPFLEKRSMDRIETEARQLYQLQQRRLQQQQASEAHSQNSAANS